MRRERSGDLIGSAEEHRRDPGERAFRSASIRSLALRRAGQRSAVSSAPADAHARLAALCSVHSAVIVARCPACCSSLLVPAACSALLVCASDRWLGCARCPGSQRRWPIAPAAAASGGTHRERAEGRIDHHPLLMAHRSRCIVPLAPWPPPEGRTEKDNGKRNRPNNKKQTERATNQPAPSQRHPVLRLSFFWAQRLRRGRRGGSDTRRPVEAHCTAAESPALLHEQPPIDGPASQCA